MLSELHSVAIECSQDNWDDFGAFALSKITIANAESLIRVLPETITAPEISAEPDGEISFDWLLSRIRTCSLSINVKNRLIYAWIDGSNRGKATEVFDHGTLPERLLNELQRMSRVAR